MIEIAVPMEADAHEKLTAFRAQLLQQYSRDPSVLEALLAYNSNPFRAADSSEPRAATAPPRGPYPLPAEPHVAVWQEYLQEAESAGVFPVLQRHLVQLQFPIQAGISDRADYRAATRKGQLPAAVEQRSSLMLQQPEALQLSIYPALAGAIPVMVAGCRADFVTLVQALTKRNEPHPVPAAMGACIVGGYNNWDRVHRYRERWANQNPDHCSAADWAAEFQRLVPQKTLYQDRFILLSNGPYSNVEAAALGLSDADWQAYSGQIRLAHECTHYFTRRVLQSMRNHLLDELIADYMGIVAAIGHYRADWFLHFLGLEAYPDYRQGGRLEAYRGEPPLSDAAFVVLQRLVKQAAENLAEFDQALTPTTDGGGRSPVEQTAVLLALTRFTLEELAAEQAVELMAQAVQQEKAALGAVSQS